VLAFDLDVVKEEPFEAESGEFCALCLSSAVRDQGEQKSRLLQLVGRLQCPETDCSAPHEE
jgi:hypothetical protein